MQLDLVAENLCVCFSGRFPFLAKVALLDFSRKRTDLGISSWQSNAFNQILCPNSEVPNLNSLFRLGILTLHLKCLVQTSSFESLSKQVALKRFNDWMRV